MVRARSKSLSLQEFLQLPETKPASEYINGDIIQKPVPKGRHSRLQGKLCATINQVAEEAKIAYAFPEMTLAFWFFFLGNSPSWVRAIAVFPFFPS